MRSTGCAANAQGDQTVFPQALRADGSTNRSSETKGLPGIGTDHQRHSHVPAQSHFPQRIE